MDRRFDASQWAAAATSLLLLVPCVALVAVRGFDGLYGQDPYAYLEYALGPLRGALARAELPPSFAWPPGFPLLIALASLFVGPGPLAGLAVSLVAGSCVPILTALLGRELLDGVGRRGAWGIGILAGAIVALTGQLWQSSVVVMSDTSALAFAVGGAWAVARFGRVGSARWLALASALLAFAIVTRWVYGLVALPLAVAALAVVVRGARGRAAVTRLAAGAVPGTLVLLPVLAPIASAVLGGSTPPFSADFGVHAWDPLNALRRTFETPDGTLGYGTTTGAYYVLTLAQPWFLSPLLLPLAGVGAIAATRHAGLMPRVVLLAWPLLMLGFLVGLTHQNPRFLLPLVPPLAILVALGVRALHRAVPQAARGGPRAAARVGLGVLVMAGLGVMVVGGSVLTVRFIDRQQADRSAWTSLASRLPADARVISFGPTLGLRRLLGEDVVELYELPPAAALSLVADGRPTYLLLDADGVTRQWSGRTPGLTFEALRRERGLAPVAREGIYTLFAVGPMPGAAVGRVGRQPIVTSILPLGAAP